MPLYSILTYTHSFTGSSRDLHQVRRGALRAHWHSTQPLSAENPDRSTRLPLARRALLFHTDAVTGSCYVIWL